MKFDLPRELFPSLNMSERTYMNLAFCLTVLGSVLIFLPSFWTRWDVTEYDLDKLASHYNISTDVRQSQTNLSNDVRFLYEDGILWDTAGGQKCAGTPNGWNGTVLFTEAGGVWKLCRIIADELAFAKIKGKCSPISQCMRYADKDSPKTNSFQSYCCGGCCPYHQRQRTEMSEAGLTTHEALYTTISSVVVAMILQGASYCQVVLSYKYGYVTMSRMTGVTLMLSAVFMSFALIVTHYRVALMAAHVKFLPYVPSEVVLVSSTSVGWCVYVGWAAVIVNVLVACIWIQLSRYQVQLRSNKRPSSSQAGQQPNPKQRTSLSARLRSGRKTPLVGPSQMDGKVNNSNHVNAKLTPSINVQEL